MGLLKAAIRAKGGPRLQSNDAIAGLLSHRCALRHRLAVGAVGFTRMLDGVEPSVTGEIHHAAAHGPGAYIVEAKTRSIGHTRCTPLLRSTSRNLVVVDANKIEFPLESELFEHMSALGTAHVRFSERTRRS
ncbi:MAG: hypothetical protein BGN87_03425 [Rhizobiales bacterium 65-79]|nr:hypothetical protein [Hyphomicrobiales bacterium]OJU04832.1 MAG: hypothetical protein BGN87_03425 [Rhizobiales bacterium 65-79]